MRVLIRFITRTPAGSTEQHDRIIDTSTITIGRATDQILKLNDRRARLEHARIEAHDSGIRIIANTLAGVSVNGRSVREAALVAGDEIEIGSNILRVIDAPDGADFAFSFELAEDASSEHLDHSWTVPRSGIAGLGKRPLAFGLIGIIVLVTLAVPALSLLGPPIADFLRSTPLLPDDGVWLAGPVHSAHSTTATNCGNCHLKAFERVPDEACTDCHEVGRHVADDAHAVLGERRCASCHLEHNEPPQLVRAHQGLCSECHGDPGADIDLPAASDFLDAHPAFRVSLWAPPAGTDRWQVVRLVLSDADGAEHSRLRFDHAAHLDPAGIVTPGGTRVIGCDECHRPEPGGARMQPISMDEHCAGCHTLDFDPGEPDRVVPHGDPAAVVQTLVEYYSARLLGEDDAGSGQRLRRPGQAMTRAERDRAAAEAREQALEVARELFERRACATCHEVVASGDETAPWAVLDVKLTNRFLPHAEFSHAAHDTGVTDCTSCHDASASTDASDLLIPDIDNCRQCHGSGFRRRNTGDQLASTCIVCHAFHTETAATYP